MNFLALPLYTFESIAIILIVLLFEIALNNLPIRIPLCFVSNSILQQQKIIVHKYPKYFVFYQNLRRRNFTIPCIFKKLYHFCNRVCF